LVLLHIEAQGSGGGDGDFAEHMFYYMTLIYGHYRRLPAALAIVTDKRPVKEHTFFY
jgi:hypothetical protein